VSTVCEELLVEVVVEVPVGVDVWVLVVVGVVVVVLPLPVVGTTTASSEVSYCAIAGVLPNNTDTAKPPRNKSFKGLDDMNHPPVKMIGSICVVVTKIFGK
jgi:hypothetical protein